MKDGRLWPARPCARTIHTTALTSRQKRLIEELNTIASSLGADYWNCEDWPLTEKTTRLEVTLRWFVRGEIVYQYTLVDEILACRICWYFFGKRSFSALWRTSTYLQ